MHAQPVAGVGADIRINARLVGALKLSFCISRGCSSRTREKDLAEGGTKRRAWTPGPGGTLRDLPSSSIEPGWAITKLCGIRSMFSKMNSTGLPACKTSTSLS